MLQKYQSFPTCKDTYCKLTRSAAEIGIKQWKRRFWRFCNVIAVCEILHNVIDIVKQCDWAGLTRLRLTAYGGANGFFCKAVYLLQHYNFTYISLINSSLKYLPTHIKTDASCVLLHFDIHHCPVLQTIRVKKLQHVIILCVWECGETLSQESSFCFCWKCF